VTAVAASSSEISPAPPAAALWAGRDSFLSIATLQISVACCVICDRVYHFVIAVRREKQSEPHRVKYWETIADDLSKASWSWGCVSALDSAGRTIWIADAHRDDGKHAQGASRTGHQCEPHLRPRQLPLHMIEKTWPSSLNGARCPA
jgi:hypothetical protein